MPTELYEKVANLLVTLHSESMSDRFRQYTAHDLEYMYIVGLLSPPTGLSIEVFLGNYFIAEVAEGRF